MKEYIEREPLLEIAKKQQGDTFGAPLIVKAIEEAPTVDVAEVVKNALLDLKKQIHDKAVYTNSQDVANYVQLKVFDAVLNNVIKRYTEGGWNA